jgi:hypothetical protein
MSSGRRSRCPHCRHHRCLLLRENDGALIKHVVSRRVRVRHGIAILDEVGSERSRFALQAAQQHAPPLFSSLIRIVSNQREQ